MLAPDWIAKVDSLKEQNLYRSCKTFIKDGAKLIDSATNKKLINFSSNDYLALADDPDLKKSYQAAIEKYGCSSSSSPLVCGNLTIHSELEELLCSWQGFERALFFNSGFSANQALLFSLLNKDDLVVQDKLNHASLQEAAHLLTAKSKRFAHNDCEHLNSILEKNTTARQRLVISEGVFSMDGDLAPIAEISKICSKHQALFMLDDAHGCGILGADGAGSCKLAKIKPDILLITFGKAWGLNGAAILCSNDCAEYLTQKARHFIYSTAMAPAHAAAVKCALGIIQTQNWRRERLAQLSSLLASELSLNVPMIKTATPIKPIIVGSAKKALEIADFLYNKNILLSAIRPPTVAVNTARLRLTLNVAHSDAQIKYLARCLNQAFLKHGNLNV